MDALCKSTSSILSSGLTTVIGFLALAFMQFKIGPDLGLALAKGRRHQPDYGVYLYACTDSGGAEMVAKIPAPQLFTRLQRVWTGCLPGHGSFGLCIRGIDRAELSGFQSQRFLLWLISNLRCRHPAWARYSHY